MGAGDQARTPGRSRRPRLSTGRAPFPPRSLTRWSWSFTSWSLVIPHALLALCPDGALERPWICEDPLPAAGYRPTALITPHAVDNGNSAKDYSGRYVIDEVAVLFHPVFIDSQASVDQERAASTKSAAFCSPHP